MTWTWGGDPGVTTAAQRRDAVRSLTGDTVSGQDITNTDEQIAFYLLSYPALTMTAVLMASADAADALAGRSAAQADSVSIGKTRIEYRDGASRYHTLSADLRRRARTGVNGFFPQGISVAANVNSAANSDTVQPQAYVGRDADPGTLPALSTSEQRGT